MSARPKCRQMQQCSVSGGGIDWTSGPEYFSAQQQQPGFSFQGQQELESYQFFHSQVSEWWWFSSPLSR